MTEMKSNEQTLEQQVEALLSQMTLREKIALLTGQDNWNTVPIPRLGIPSITMTDGPHGVRADRPEPGRKVGLTTCFPTGVSMAASWNTELIHQVGAALAEETRGMDCDIILGPCVNIVRSPLGGRNFESYSEDPFLGGKIGVAMIKGVQSQKVGTSLKHYAVNNYEIERGRASSNIDERTLREIYLAQFEMAVKEAQPWTVMCSYNRINGVYASQHEYLLNKILRDEWGFEGLVVSDWGANHTIFSSIHGGLDLEMPGPAKYYRFLGEAVYNWQIEEHEVTQAARRVLRLILQTGRMDGATSQGSVNTAEHQALARTLSEEAITLLKNEGDLLPVDLSKVKSIAIIGPNAAEAVIEGGGSSHVVPPYRVTPLEALQARLGGKVKLQFEQGCDNFNEPPAVPLAWLQMPDGNGAGMQRQVFRNSDFSGEPEQTHANVGAEAWWFVGTAETPAQEKVGLRVTGVLKVPADGQYTLQLGHNNWVRLYLDDELVFDSHAPAGESMHASRATVSVVRQMSASQPVRLRLEIVKEAGSPVLAYRFSMAAFYQPGEDMRLARAVELARNCDIALVFIGNPEGYESEGNDRPDMKLPGGQDALVAAIAQANPRTAVILNAGSPVEMPWVNEVAALVEAYYPGQENGNAVARVLLGDVNPSGKLPITFPKRLEDNPSFINPAYPGCREVNYGEGIFVGYRYYDKVDLAPLFPFGHGLSYTAFEYGEIQAPAQVKAGETFQVSLTVKNTGQRAGKEVVQLYIADPQAALPRPPKELKGFQKVLLQPGESQTLTFTLDPRALSYYNPHRKGWVAEPGAFEILVGSSSQNIRSKASFILI